MWDAVEIRVVRVFLSFLTLRALADYLRFLLSFHSTRTTFAGWLANLASINNALTNDINGNEMK